MRATKQDEELTLLLTKLYTIQEQVGAKEPSSSSDKRSRAEQAGQQLQQQQSAMMGRTRKSKRVGSRFLELKSSIVEHLRTVHTLIEAQNNSKKLNPKEVIAAQAEIREVIRQASDEWAEINELYKNEARKKKSKFTPEELEVQQALVTQLKSEIDKVKEGQLATHARGGMAEQQNVQLNLSALAALDAVDFSMESTTGGGNGKKKQGEFTFHLPICLLPTTSSHFFIPYFHSLLSSSLFCIRHVQIMDSWWRWRHRNYHVPTTSTRTDPSPRCRIRYRTR
jgi:hypothetical protein